MRDRERKLGICQERVHKNILWVLNSGFSMENRINCSLLSPLYLCILWSFCKEHTCNLHICKYVKYQYFHWEKREREKEGGKKKRRKEGRQKEGSKEGREGERERGRSRRVREVGSLTSQMPLSLFLHPSPKMPCPFNCMIFSCHCHWLFYTPSSWECPLLVFSKKES